MLGFLSLPLCSVSFAFSFHSVNFHQVGLLLWLGLHFMGLSWGCFNLLNLKWDQMCWGSVWFHWFCLAAAKVWNGRPVLQLSYSSVLFGKQRKVHPRALRAGPPQMRGLNPFWLPLFINFVSYALSLPYANWASQEGGMFVSPEVLTPVCGFSFVPFLRVFPFLWNSFSYSKYLTNWKTIKQIHINGPSQFKPMSFKGQLYV